MDTLSGTFEWKIDNFWNARRGHRSPVFEICGSSCTLYISASIHANISGSEDRIAYYDFCLFKSCVYDPSLHRASYKISVLDRLGREFITVNGNLGSILHHLMTLGEFYLKAHAVDLLPGGNLAIRFSWFEGESNSVCTQTTEAAITGSQKTVSDQASQSDDTPQSAGSHNNFFDQANQTDAPQSVESPRDVIFQSTPKSSKSAESGGNFFDQETQTETSYYAEADLLLVTLSNDFERFHNGKMDSDCVLKVGNVQFPVHRSVLSARSSVLAAMFHHDTVERASGEAHIQDVDEDTLGNVLHYVYSAKVRGLDANSAVAMYIAADKYDLLELREACTEYLSGNLTTENICDAALLAHTHGEGELEWEVVQFVEGNLREVQESDGWKKFLNDKPFLANKILSSAVLSLQARLKPLNHRSISEP